MRTACVAANPAAGSAYSTGTATTAAFRTGSSAAALHELILQRAARMATVANCTGKSVPREPSGARRPPSRAGDRTTPIGLESHSYSSVRCEALRSSCCTSTHRLQQQAVLGPSTAHTHLPTGATNAMKRGVQLEALTAIHLSAPFPAPPSPPSPKQLAQDCVRTPSRHVASLLDTTPP